MKDGRYLLTWQLSEGSPEMTERFESKQEALAVVEQFKVDFGDYGRPFTISWKLEQVEQVDSGTVQAL